MFEFLDLTFFPVSVAVRGVNFDLSTRHISQFNLPIDFKACLLKF